MATAVHPGTQASLEEAIREIHATAGLSGGDRSSHEEPARLAIGVTSPNRSDGKTTITMSLAGSLSRDFSADVTLADADFHTQSLEREYGLETADGLADVLAGTATIGDVAHSLPTSRMKIVRAGSRVYDVARIARSGHAATLVENMKRDNRYVVFDLPATLPSTTAPVLARLCDGVIVVVRAGQTTKQQLDRTLVRLKGSQVLGVVVNRWTSAIPEWAEAILALRR